VSLDIRQFFFSERYCDVGRRQSGPLCREAQGSRTERRGRRIDITMKVWTDRLNLKPRHQGVWVPSRPALYTYRKSTGTFVHARVKRDPKQHPLAAIDCQHRAKEEPKQTPGSMRNSRFNRGMLCITRSAVLPTIVTAGTATFDPYRPHRS